MPMSGEHKESYRGNSDSFNLMLSECIISYKQHLLYSLLPPTAVTGIHSLAQFFLFGILVVVFLDGSGAVAGHFGNMGNRSTRIEFAGDKRASCRVPRHFFVDAQNLANLVQRFADEGREIVTASHLLFVGYVFLGIDREDVVADTLASVFFQNYDQTVDEQGLGQLGEFGTFIDNHAFLFVNHVPGQVDDIDIGHTAAVKAEEEKVKTELLLLGKEAAVHELHPADDVRIDGFRLELSPRHFFRSRLEDCGVGSVHVEFVFGVVYQSTEDAKELAQPGTVTIFDAAPFQIDDVFQKEFLGNVGEVKAG